MFQPSYTCVCCFTFLDFCSSTFFCIAFLSTLLFLFCVLSILFCVFVLFYVVFMSCAGFIMGTSVAKPAD